MLSRLVAYIRGLVGRRKNLAEADEELRFHLEQEEAANLTRGMSAAEARRVARRDLGGLAQTRERVWGVRSLWTDTLGRDVRLAARLLVRRPAFSAAAVLTLALAIGANLAIFSLIDRVVLHPLSVSDPSALVTVQQTFKSNTGERRTTSMTWEAAGRIRGMTTLESVALSTSSSDRATTRLALSLDGADKVTATGRFVTANYLQVLGVRAAVGRDFRADDDAVDAPAVVMLSHRFWRARLGGEAAAIGRTIGINGVPTILVGVVEASFTGVDLSATPPDVYLPLMTASRLAANEGMQTDGRGGFFNGGSKDVLSPVSPVADLMLIGRVGSNTAPRAQAELSSLFETGLRDIVPLVETMLPFDSRADLRVFLGLLAAAVGLTLLIGCANLASLFLARAEERRVEMAIRAALGAGRLRLIREVVVEAGLLAAVGGLAAIVLAGWISQGLSSFVLPGGIALSALRDAVDGRMILFAIAMTAFAAIVIGIAPAAGVAAGRLTLDVKRQGGGSPRLGVTRALAAVQVAVCVVLVFSAGLFVRTLSNALGTDLGFDAQGLVSASISVPVARRTGGLMAVDALVDRARAMPGVSAVTVGPLPLTRGSDVSRNAMQVDGVPVALSGPVDVVYAGADYFTTLRLAMTRGRDFDVRDREGALPVAIVNEAAARQFWPGVDPLTRTVGFPRPGQPSATSPGFVVVGTVRDVKVKDLRETDRPVVYLARLQHQAYLAGYLAGSGSSFLIVRANGNASGVAPSLARLAADEGLSVQSVTTLAQTVDQLLTPQRLGRILLLLLSVTALALTVVGVYGLVACSVARHTKEIAIRIALGASTRTVVRAVALRTAAPIVVGVACGTGLALWGGHFADRFMYGMSGSDPGTIAVSIMAVVVSGLVAAWPPVRRALGINPVDILRSE